MKLIEEAHDCKAHREGDLSLSWCIKYILRKNKFSALVPENGTTLPYLCRRKQEKQAYENTSFVQGIHLAREYNQTREADIIFAELNDKWVETDMSEGVEMARTTFNRHKDAIQDIFGIYIECDRSDGYRFVGKPNPVPENKQLLIIPGASHCDLYDGGYTALRGKGNPKNLIPWDKLEKFFKENLK